MNATVIYYFLPIGMNAIYAPYNEFCLSIVFLKCLQWIWWKYSKSQKFDLVEWILRQAFTSSAMTENQFT